MTHSKMSKVMALVLCMVMLLSVFPTTAFASIADWDTKNVVFEGTSFGTNGYYNVISKKDYTLVPGAAVESEMVLNNSAGTRRQVMHIIELDPSNPDVSIVPGYYGIDNDLSDVNNWKPAGVTETVKYYEDNLGYNVVGAMNTSLAYDNNSPIDFLVYNGVNLSQGEHHAQTFLAVIKDPVTGEISCELHNYADGIPENCWQAVSANFAFTVKDGVLVAKTEERTSSAAARSMIGIKEDGTLVLVMNDGRGANNSVGFCNYELGESMLALGCKWAVNCDGGGSSSFVTKRSGETVNTMRCVPCDGAERPTINSILITSNVGPTGELNNVNIMAEYDYFAPGTSYTFAANAIDTHGYAMDMPADSTWAVSDETYGTIANGIFVSNGKVGDVDIQVVSGGVVVGSKTIHISNPESITLSATSTTLPYSTETKPRKVTLPIVATVGEENVFFDSSVFEVTSSVEAAGTFENMTFTATTDESISSTVITATYIPTGAKLTFIVNFGKGSEILWDFEDGDISNWYGGGDDVKVWLTENGVAEGDQLKTLISGGQISFSEQSHTFLSTRENGGQVHNGNNSLGVSFDFRNVEFNSWVYALLYNVQDQYVLRDVANGKKATALGMWCYVPEGFCNPAGDTSGALAMQLTVYKNPQGTSGTQLNFQFYSEHQKKRVSLNQCTEADIPENRWVYLTADLTGSDYYSLPNPKGTTYREPSFFRMYIKPTRAQVLTYYFDDFTLDYSSAVDDRDAPLITNTTFCLTDSNLDLSDNPVINSNTVSFDASIADYLASNSEGLNYSTAAIYADGVKLSGVTASGNSMGVKNVALTDGEHSIKFEIYDNAGNFASVTKKITISSGSGKATVSLAGHNDKNNIPEYDSVYYADIVASDISEINSVGVTLKLNTANSWELDHIVVAPGFSAEYSYNNISKLANISIVRTGDSVESGEMILASIPARVWSFDESTNVGGDGSGSQHMTAKERFNSTYGEPKVFVDVSVVSGAIEYTDNSEGTFGGSISVATKLTGNKSNGIWHQHTANDVDNKLATCEEAGYTGRTYCDECGSVVNWGENVPVIGHTYELVDGKFVCSDCGDVYDAGTGLFEMNGKTYYAIAGNLVTGWQQVDGVYYNFRTDNYEARTGNFKYGSVTYLFDETGKLTSGVWYNNGEGYRYYYGPDYYRCTAANTTANGSWYTIDGKTYCFDRDGYRHEGIRVIISSNSLPELYEFTDEGVLVGKFETDYTGLFECNGQKCYLENGVPQQTGMIKVGNDYYYINSTYTCVTGEYHCTNHLIDGIPVGTYTFDADGKLVNPPVVKSGVYEENGKLYYYVDGSRVKAGAVQVGDDVYYFGYSYYAPADGRYYLMEEMMNGILPAGNYDIKDGKLVIRNGVYQDGDKLYYYVNNERVKAGAVQVGDDLYYFGMNYYALADGIYYLPAEMLHDIVPANNYQIKDGKIVIRNGVIEENGKLYYFVNNVKTKAGAVRVGDDVYYFGYNYYAPADGRYYLMEEMMNGVLPAGNYDIVGGKLVIRNGVYQDGDKLYYYVNNERVKAGAVQVGDDLYYFGMNYYALTDGIYYLPAEMLHDIVPANNYQIKDGKIVIRNGVYEENGKLYYFVNNVKTKAGAVRVGDDVYYFGYNYYAPADGRYYITEEMLNGIYPAGTYDIKDGKIYTREGIYKDGDRLYYYQNNEKVKAGLVYDEETEAYYYFGVNYFALSNGVFEIYGEQLHGLLPAGKYVFDADGKLQEKDGFVKENNGIYYYKNNVLQKGAGLIIVDNDFYYVMDNGKLATSGKYQVSNNNDWIRANPFTFDENGKMIADSCGVLLDDGYYVKGVRYARDIAFLNPTSNGVKIKQGMVIRGTELDNAVWPMDEELAQAGVDVLKEDYFIKFEMDLRAALDQGKDVFGEGVTHKYYDMVYYDQIFTDEGKAKVKEIFTDLANPDNYPVYVHCTYGLDRTGTVCYLIEALLGMDDWALSHDYCSTKNSHEPSILKVKAGLQEYSGETRMEQTESYLLSCGITQQQINTIRTLLIENN